MIEKIHKIPKFIGLLPTFANARIKEKYFASVHNSHSQFQEDMIIDKILNKENGFYVDIGANDPIRLNNTYKFYKRGWTGINIEPNKIKYDKIVKCRPKDITLNMGINNEKGELTFYVTNPDSHSTFSREEVNAFKGTHIKVTDVSRIKVDTLSSVLNKHAKKEIDLMSIDTEGFDLRVLESNDWDKYRPKLICVEINKQSNEHEEIKDFMISKNYFEIYNNGLNSLFVSEFIYDNPGNIIMKMGGGLGNQLFNYAFGRTLSIETGKELTIDTTIYNPNSIPKREYLLHKYNVVCREISGAEKIIPLSYRISKKLNIKMNAFNQDTMGNDVALVKFPMPNWGESIIYEGGWQSPKYFKKYNSLIKQELTLKKVPKIDKVILDAVNKDNSVSIHFRRTDYVPLGWSDTYMKDYYEKAIQYIKKNVKNPRFFIFSDDIEWVKKNYSFGGTEIYCSSLGLKDYEELFLIGRCNHNINSNSTFSWWGTFLSKRGGIKLSPKMCLPFWKDQENTCVEGWVLL